MLNPGEARLKARSDRTDKIEGKDVCKGGSLSGRRKKWSKGRTPFFGANDAPLGGGS